MGYGTDGLTFNTLRGGNVARLPTFRNSKGDIAHTKPDGSDWSPPQWFQALFGEVGELAEAWMLQALGAGSEEHVEKETADVQIYLDLWANRCRDKVTLKDKDGDVLPFDAPLKLMHLVALLGAYANARKKFDRGDYDFKQFATMRYRFLLKAQTVLQDLVDEKHCLIDRPVVEVRQGINLGQVTMDKFNATSKKVKSPVYIDADDWHYR